MRSISPAVKTRSTAAATTNARTPIAIDAIQPIMASAK